MVEVPAATPKWTVLTAVLPRSSRAYTVPGSDTSTRARTTRRAVVTFATRSVGATVSPSSTTVSGEAEFSNGAGPVPVTIGAAADSHGRPGSVTGVGSPAATVMSPNMLSRWIEQ